MQAPQASHIAWGRLQYAPPRWRREGFSGERPAILCELRRICRYYTPDEGFRGRLMQPFAAAVEHDVICLQFRATPHRQRFGMRRKRHKDEPWRQMQIGHTWGFFFASQHLQMVQLRPGDPGPKLAAGYD